MLTRFTIIAACAVIGPASADPTYTVDEARLMIAAAVTAQVKCPGVKVDDPKVWAMLDDSHLDHETVLDENAKFVGPLQILLDPARVELLCRSARDPSFPFHFLLDIENERRNAMSDEYDLIQDEKVELLTIIAQQIEQRAPLESELGEVDPDLAQMRKGLEILRRELALHQTRLLH
jgi:hypothetical protein